MTRLTLALIAASLLSAPGFAHEDGAPLVERRYHEVSDSREDARYKELTQNLAANVGKSTRLQLREASALGPIGCHVFKSLTEKGEAALEYAKQADEVRIAEKDLFYATKMFNARAQTEDLGVPTPTQADLEQVKTRVLDEQARLAAVTRVAQTLNALTAGRIQVKKDADFERRPCPGEVSPRSGIRY